MILAGECQSLMNTVQIKRGEQTEGIKYWERDESSFENTIQARTNND